jgi:hypothetical protein
VARIRSAVEIFNTDHPKYGGSGLFENQQIAVIQNNGRNMLFRLNIPPLATLVLEEHLA